MFWMLDGFFFLGGGGGLNSHNPRIFDSWHAACVQLEDQYGLRSS